MKKIGIILIVLALIAISCGQNNTKKQVEIQRVIETNSETVSEQEENNTTIKNEIVFDDDEALISFIENIFDTLGQIILPDKSVVIDTIKRAECQQIVAKINAMQLKCDTVFKEYRNFTGIYFDKKGRLRKYYRRERGGDGGANNIMSAYYNENGELVYLFSTRGNNCEDRIKSYYIYEGCIVDFVIKMICYCCDDEDLTQEEINRIRPVIGNPLKNWELNLTNFIYAKTLLKILQSGEYYEYKEFDEF